MKAVVLVGGEGTRLRPLTETVPKPLLPLMDRPFLHQVLDHLSAHGVHEVVLSSSYLEAAFLPALEARRGDPRVTWITEGQPLGTGGAIVNALSHLDADEPFLVLNGDILTDLDLTALLGQHRADDAAVTIALTAVADARPYGLVETRADGRVLAFREKPTGPDPVPGNVNAGTYVVEPRALDGFDTGSKLSIERDVFPSLIARGLRVFGHAWDAYWMDLGTPQKYLRAHFDILEGRVGGLAYPAPFVAEGSSVDLQAHLGRWVVVAVGARVAPDAEVEDSVIHAGASVGAGASVRSSILGAGTRVGAGARLIRCVLGEGAEVADGESLVDRSRPEIPAGEESG